MSSYQILYIITSNNKQKLWGGTLLLIDLTQTDILTVEELHTYLKIPKPTIYALAQNGRIPAAKVGKHWRFRRTEIDEWLKAQQWNRPLQRRRRLKGAGQVAHE